ncbi:MAG: hypothetical protein GY765_40135 [bacterium]|nr:hypothetical protein [bacterium]
MKKQSTERKLQLTKTSIAALDVDVVRQSRGGVAIGTWDVNATFNNCPSRKWTKPCC